MDDALALNPVKPSLDNLIEQYCRLHGVTEAELASPGRTRRHARIRAEIAKSAQEQGSATITEIAKRFNRTSAALSMLVSCLRQQQNTSGQ